MNDFDTKNLNYNNTHDSIPYNTSPKNSQRKIHQHKMK